MDQRLMLPCPRVALVVSTCAWLELSLKARSHDRDPVTHQGVRSPVWIAHDLHRSVKDGNSAIQVMHHERIARYLMEHQTNLRWIWAGTIRNLGSAFSRSGTWPKKLYASSLPFLPAAPLSGPSWDDPGRTRGVL